MPQGRTVTCAYEGYLGAARLSFKVLSVHCDANKHRLCRKVFWSVRNSGREAKDGRRVDVHAQTAAEFAEHTLDAPWALIVWFALSSGCEGYKESIVFFTYVG